MGAGEAGGRKEGGGGEALPFPTMQREMEMVDVDLTAGDDIVLESLPAQGRVNFRAICGAAGKELGPPVIELDAISKVYTLPGRDEEVAALRSISMKVSSEVYPILRGEFVLLRAPRAAARRRC